MLRAAASSDAAATSQLLPGEGFDVLDVAAGWAWGSGAHDRYVGYVPADALVHRESAATHRIVAAAAPLFAGPDIKSPVCATWPLAAMFAAAEIGDFLATEYGYVHRRHAVPIGQVEADPAGVALRFSGQPYLWGGRGAGGIDCSGLVQIALGLCGIAAPRDSDMQQAAVGRALGATEALRRGDLVFFPGHVGMMIDGSTLIHATAHWMAVVVEPLAEVSARLAAVHAAPILARRRPI